MSHNIVIQEGAFFVSDAHYNVDNGETKFLDFLQKIATQELQPTQLFLLGDIFDTLFGEVPYTAKKNQEVIDLIELIASKMEVIYLEGNHDFQLRYFFSQAVHIFPLKMQPLTCSANNKTVLIAHGDFDAPFGYQLYTALIRNKIILKILNLYDTITQHSILNFVAKHMAKKQQCKVFDWFDTFTQKRLEDGFSCDVYIDGHFHQNKVFTLNNIKYINLGAFACNQRYFVVKFKQDEIILEEKTLL
jgi:UDP-2,3-diacylglucosamine hydrolase